MLEKGDIKIEDGDVLEFNGIDWVKADLDEDDKLDFINRAKKWENGGKDRFLKQKTEWKIKDKKIIKELLFLLMIALPFNLTALYNEGEFYFLSSAILLNSTILLARMLYLD